MIIFATISCNNNLEKSVLTYYQQTYKQLKTNFWYMQWLAAFSIWILNMSGKKFIPYSQNSNP